jgi:hypothetical protein
MTTTYLVAMQIRREDLTISFVPKILSDLRQKQTKKKNIYPSIEEFKIDIFPISLQERLSMIEDKVTSELRKQGVVFPFGHSDLIFMTESMVAEYINFFTKYETVFNKIKTECLIEYDRKFEEAVNSYMEKVIDPNVRKELSIAINANILPKKIYEESLNMKFEKLPYVLTPEIEDIFFLASLQTIINCIKILVEYYKQKEPISDYVLDHLSLGCKRIKETNIMKNETVEELLENLENIFSYGRYDRTKSQYKKIRNKAFSLLSQKGLFGKVDI